MAEAGWYPDPQTPGQLRYWDGTIWTEHVHVPDRPPAPYGQVPSGPPVFAAAPDPNVINDIGEWLKQTFRVGFAKIVPCLVLTALGLLPWLAIIGLVFAALNDLEFDDDQVSGFSSADSALLVVAGLIGVLSLFWYAVTLLAQSYLLHESHIGRNVGLGEALDVGWRALPRLIKAYLVIFGIGLVVAAVLGLAIAGLVVTENALFVIPLILFYLVMIPVSFWLQVKLAFIPIAAAVAPSGKGALPLSMGLSKGRFWPVFGRLLLLSIILSFAIVPLQMILMPVMMASMPIDSTAANDTVSFSEIFVPTAIFTLVITLFSFVIQIFNYSGTARLYVDLDGPRNDSGPGSTGPTAAI